MSPRINESLKLTNLEVTVEILPALLPGFRYPSIMLDPQRVYLLRIAGGEV